MSILEKAKEDWPPPGIEWYYADDSCAIACADCRDVLPKLPNVDLVFTSPPYWKQRNYELKEFDWIESVAKVLPKCQITEKGQILVNLGLIHNEGMVFTYWDQLFYEAAAEDLRLFGWYVWDQGKGLPGEWNGRLAPSHEFIFHFNRSAEKLNKSVPKQENSGPMGSNIRSKDGKKAPPSSICNDTHKIHDSVFRINRDYSHGVNHPAIFPLKLAKSVINAFPGKIILDPYCGSGTTLRAAKDLGRKAIGIEIEEKYVRVAIDRLKQQVMKF